MIDDAFTTCLFHFDGAHESVIIPDASGKVWTVNNHAKLSNAASKFGGTSLLLDGTDDTLTITADTIFSYGFGDVTVDCWVYLPNASLAGEHYILGGQATGQVCFGFDGANVVIGRKGVSWEYTTGHGISNNTWAHVAFVRKNLDAKIFVNGSQVGSTAQRAYSWDITTTAYLGSQGTINFLNGYIDELRISKGIGRWIANFTPPAAPYRDPTKYLKTSRDRLRTTGISLG